MESKGRWQFTVAVAIFLVTSGAVLVFLWPSEQAEPTDAPGPAEAHDSSAGHPAVGPGPSARQATPAVVPKPTSSRRLPAGIRGRAIDPKTRRAMLSAILDKIAERQKARAKASKSQVGEPPAQGSLPKEYIQQQVREIIPLVKECYEMALETDPKLAGSMKVHFTIVGDEDHGGLVTESQVLEESTLTSNADMVECIRETMYALRLEAPEGGGQVEVTYPFIFNSIGYDDSGE